MKKIYETPAIKSYNFMGTEILQGLAKSQTEATDPAYVKENSNLPVINMDSDDDW